jgi:4'-phosphopantetheinyl transferase
VEELLWNQPRAESFSLNGATHLWKISLEPVNIEALSAHLSEDELNRANRFAFDRLRRHFIAAHGQLRILLSRYLPCDPAALHFGQNKYGKPFIIDNPLCFNLSHSHQLGLIAINGKNEVGVDIEYIRPNFDDLRIANRFFSPGEAQQLFELPAGSQKKAFFDCWSRKEAYIKARGKGLAIPLSQFRVSLIPGEPAELLRTDHDPGAVQQWKLHAIYPDWEYAGAVVVKSMASPIRCWDIRYLFSNSFN